ncbi:hypothetical protein NQ317_008729 [Molorchus minor]|uniref:Uncharacterized protein n=1 Tax=Molorchus minor TaxID=1323400 RepID=A0ABQ9ITE9_9CUCU|nr:hypothetical protein NQ317_008729 [Molorchus minor]
MDTLYNQTNKLIQQTQQVFQTLEGNAKDTLEIETEIQEKINLIYSYHLISDKMQKMRCHQLKYDCRHLQAALEVSRQKRARREAAANEREQLLNRRFTPNPDVTAINIDYAIQQQNSLQNANKGVDENVRYWSKCFGIITFPKINFKGCSSENNGYG